jgi:hypothetical protein
LSSGSLAALGPQLTHCDHISIADQDQRRKLHSPILSSRHAGAPRCGSREAIVKEVRHKFITMKEAGLHPSVTAPPNTLVSKIIECTKPALIDGRIDIVAWFAQWLCKWSFFAFPDEDIKDKALDLAR